MVLSERVDWRCGFRKIVMDEFMDMLKRVGSKKGNTISVSISKIPLPVPFAYLCTADLFAQVKRVQQAKQLCKTK